MAGELVEFEKKLDIISSDVKEIKKVLAGDEYGNDGLVKEHKFLKRDYYDLKDEFKRNKWYFTGIATAVSALIASIVAWVKPT